MEQLLCWWSLRSVLIEDKAAELNAPAYAGIAKIMTAMYLGVLTDHFGDIPYTQALQGADNDVLRQPTRYRYYLLFVERW